MTVENISNNLEYNSDVLPPISIGAFVLSDALNLALAELRTDERARRTEMHCFRGGIHAALEQLNEQSYDLILIEFNDDSQNIRVLVEEIASKCPPETKAIIAGQVNDISLYRTLIELGVSDYLPAPFYKDNIAKSIIDIYREKHIDDCRTIAFIGSKGGVGASVLSHNAAQYAAETLKMNTVLIDFDFNFGLSNFSFGINTKKLFQDVIGSDGCIDSVLMKRILFAASDCLSIFPYKSPINKTQHIKSDTINKITDTSKKNSDLIILDIGNNLSEKHSDIIRRANDIVIVTEPDIVNLRNTKAILDYINFLSKDSHRISIIINKIGRNPKFEITEIDFKRITGLDNCHKMVYYMNDFSNAENMEAVISSKRFNMKSSNELRGILSKIIVNNNSKLFPVKSGIINILKRFI